MKILVNGEPRELEAPMSVEDLLVTLDLAGKPVVIEWNETPLLPREYASSMLNEADRIEIVQITAGG